MFEETINGTLEELISIFNNKSIKGEFVVVVSGAARGGKADKE
jgi:16S rRNA (cytidine1402-2'-O)-methyltransferase